MLSFREHHTLLYSISDSLKSAEEIKIAAFDLDSTLVKCKNKGKFPDNEDDWTWLYNNVPDFLEREYRNGYHIVIFTNQAGISKGKVSRELITSKIFNIIEDMGISNDMGISDDDFNVSVFIATSNDVYRKPFTGMWDFMEDHIEGHIDMESSYFIGDAAGRGKRKVNRRSVKRDFSVSDRKFAYNIGLKFFTPEEFFLDLPETSWSWRSMDPEKLIRKYSIECDIRHYNGQEMIILVGSPASGKSTFCRKFQERCDTMYYDRTYNHNRYMIVNQDELRTRKKCIQKTREYINSGYSVVIDRTNPKAQDRKYFMDIASKKDIHIRCFYMKYDRDLVDHLNSYRMSLEGRKKVPPVAINTFTKRLEPPLLDEGFDSIESIYPYLEFESEREMGLFKGRY